MALWAGHCFVLGQSTVTLAWGSRISSASCEEIDEQLLQQTQGLSKAPGKGRKGGKLSLSSEMKPGGRGVP